MQFTKATIHDLDTWEEGAVAHTPFVWENWTNREAIRRAIRQAEPVNSQKPGVYQVQVMFEDKDSRLYIGVSWAGLQPPGKKDRQSKEPQDLEGRLGDQLLAEGGTHTAKGRIKTYVTAYFDAHQDLLRQININNPFQLLQVGWSICYEPRRLELLLHLKHDPLFPDKDLFPEKEPLASKNLVDRGILLLSEQRRLPLEQFRLWAERDLGISLQNAERYINLARWVQRKNATDE